MRSIAVLVLGALGLGAGSACGGGGGGNGEPSAAKRAIDPGAQHRAESIVLKLSDFPDGWRASAPSAGNAADREKFRRCLGVDNSDLTLTGDADSDDFAMGEGTEADSGAQILESEAQARDGLHRFSEAMASDASKECLRKRIQKLIGSDYKVGEIDVGELKITPPPVDETKAWQIVIPVELTSGGFGGASASIYLDITYLRIGNAVVNVQTSDTLTPFDPELRDHLLQAIARRMSNPT